MRLWTRSLAAQFICLMLLALGLSQAIGLVVAWDERGHALKEAARGEFLGRAASVAQLLEATPAALEGGILRASETLFARFWISAEGPGDAAVWRAGAWQELAKPMRGYVTVPGTPAKPADEQDFGIDSAQAATTAPWTDLSPGAWPLARPAKLLDLNGSGGMGLAVQLEDGTWLNTAYAKPLYGSIWTSQSAISLGITALLLSALTIIAARRLTRPMQRLGVAAEALGRGEAVAPLPETGPDDIRQTAEAFNRMQDRLRRFVEDRTRMLAAIGHDLRTPVTSLRLRAEFVGDPDIREKLLATIDEIQGMTEATLAFAREEATAESTRAVDLTALVESLCDDLAEMGEDVAYADGPRILYRCRADALRRAVRNLIENAVRYGERARVSVTQTRELIEIVVEDDGPGIPDGAIERVFAPFFRLDDSRSRDTGGVGLGLSIARTIARHHGGDIVLANRRPGLRATISLPREHYGPMG